MPVLHAPVLDPLYVPLIEVDEEVPLPETVDEHAVYGASNPPAGTDNENCSDDPETDPDTVPRPVTFVLLSVIVNDPENDAPDCVICHVMVPGPEESVALPVHVPFTLAGDDGSVGVDPPPPQAVAANSASAVNKWTQRVHVRGIEGLFIRRIERVYCGWAMGSVGLSQGID